MSFVYAYPDVLPVHTAYTRGGDADDGCSRGSMAVGNVIEARSAPGDPLYRLRATLSGTSLLGGLGGIPSGRSAAGYPGDVGVYGASGALTGLPAQ